MHLKRRSTENSGLMRIADRLTFEPHRIRVDPTGHYEEGFDREFPFIIKLFYFRHQDFTPGLTWHERLELYLPLDGVARMQMGRRRVELRPGELLVVDNLQLHSSVRENTGWKPMLHWSSGLPSNLSEPSPCTGSSGATALM
jgi:hypothetical protein